MLLLSHIVSSVAAAALAVAPFHFPTGPARILVLQDDASHQSAALSMAHRAMQTQLLSDPARILVSEQPAAVPVSNAAELHLAAQADLGAGLNAFHALQLDQAADSYSAAVQKLQRVAALTGDLAGLPGALSMLAATLLLMNEPQAATPVLARLRALQPALPLPASVFNPDTAAAARRVAKRLAPPQDFTVRAFPPGGEIWIDGQFAGGETAAPHLDPTVPHYVFITHGSAPPLASVIDPTLPNAPSTYSFTLPEALAQHLPNQSAPFSDALQAARSPAAFPNPDAPSLQDLQPDEIWVLRANPTTLECIRFQLTTGRRTDLTLPLPGSWPEAHRVAQACRDADISVP